MYNLQAAQQGMALCFESAMEIMKRLGHMAPLMGRHCMEMDTQYLQKIVDGNVDFTVEEYTAMVEKFMTLNTMALNDHYDNNPAMADRHTQLLLSVLN
mgnify:FL=1